MLFQIKLVPRDQEAFHTLLDKKAAAAIVPRPYGFVAEDKGFHRMLEWNDMVDDRLPITIETTLPPALQIDILHYGQADRPRIDGQCSQCAADPVGVGDCGCGETDVTGSEFLLRRTQKQSDGLALY